MGENLTQKELAVKVLITEAAVSRFENGHDLPTALTLKRIARVLKADEEMFVIFIVRDMLRKKGFRDIELIAKKAV